MNLNCGGSYIDSPEKATNPINKHKCFQYTATVH